MTIAGSTSGGSVNACTSSSACTARGFDCCLQSQCVNDGALKPGALNLPGFDSAQEDVRINPARYTTYPQYYFVCDAAPGTTTGTTGGGETTDPDYDAQVRIMESGQLYDCINKTDGEFSDGTLKITDASERIPGFFPSTTEGSFDDINFSTINSALGTGDRANNIVKVIYGGETLYQQGSIALTGGTFTAANDNLTGFQTIALTAALPSGAKDDNLYLTYKTDGSCTKVGSTLAK